jgi:hypothetical protein
MECREGQTFTNWSQSIVVRPERLCAPRTPQEVVDLIREANAAGKKVRAYGSGWSFSDVMVTDDFLVDTSKLRGVAVMSQGRHAWRPRRAVVVGVPGAAASFGDTRILPEALRDPVAASDRRFVWVNAGTTIKELYTELDASSDDAPIGAAPRRGRWTLPTMGGASGQTLAGVIATATHGGHFDLAPIADMVRAIHLVGPDGALYWIERAGSGAITDREKLAGLSRLTGSQVKYDDTWFDAVLVSLGALGIVTSYILEVRAQYGISERRHETTWRDLRPLLESGEIFTSTRYSARDPRKRWIDEHAAAPDRRPMALGIFINPYRTSYDPDDDAPPDRRAMLITHAESARFDGEHRSPGGPDSLRLAGLIHHFENAGTLDRTRDIVDEVISSLRATSGTEGYPISHSVLDTTSGDDRPPVLSIEIAVTTQGGRHVQFIDHLLQIFDDLMTDFWRRGIKAKFAGGLNLRYTRPTRALLGMQYPTSRSATERFCHIEVIVAREQWVTGRPAWGEGNDYTRNEMENYTEVFTDRFERATAAFGARLHWGQLSRTRAHDPHRYPELDRWLAVRAALTNHGANRTFDNDFVRRHVPTWVKLSGRGRDIAVGASGAAFVIGTDDPAPGNGGIYEREGGGWRNVGGHGTRIACDPAGNWWVVNAAGEIWGPGGRKPGNARDIGIGADGSVYVIGADELVPGNGAIFRLRGDRWRATGGHGTRIAVDPSGQCWVVNSRGEIWGPGGRKPGRGRDIGVGADGTVWLIGTDTPAPGNHGVYKWTGSGWRRVEGHGVAISVGPDGKPWVVQADGEIWQLVYGG